MSLFNTALNIIKPLSILSVLAEVAFANPPVKPGSGKLHQEVQAQVLNSTQNHTQNLLESFQNMAPSYSLIGWSIAIGGALLLALIGIKQCFAKTTASQEELEIIPTAKSEEQKQFDALVEECFSLALSDSTKITEFEEKLARFKPRGEKIKERQLPCLKNIFELLNAAHRLICHPRNNIEQAAGSKEKLEKIRTALHNKIEKAFNKRREIGSNEYVFLHNSLWIHISVAAKIALIESHINEVWGEVKLHTQQASWTESIKKNQLNFVEKLKEKVATFIPKDQDKLIDETVMTDINNQVVQLQDKLEKLTKEIQQIKIFDPSKPVLTLNSN